MAKSTKAHIEANARYNKKAYDSIKIILRKDAEINADYIREHAKARGESVNGFITRAVMEAMQRDNQFVE